MTARLFVKSNRVIAIHCAHGVTNTGHLDQGTLDGVQADHAAHYRAAFREHEDLWQCGCALPRILAYGGDMVDEQAERRTWQWNDGREPVRVRVGRRWVRVVSDEAFAPARIGMQEALKALAGDDFAEESEAIEGEFREGEV